MRWALVGVALLLAVAGLLYRGGTAFVSTFSGGVGGPGTVAPARPRSGRAAGGNSCACARAFACEPCRAVAGCRTGRTS